MMEKVTVKEERLEVKIEKVIVKEELLEEVTSFIMLCYLFNHFFQL